jgi:hypothetical protein
MMGAWDVSGRPTHTDKDLERLLKWSEDQGWRVEKGSKYYKMYCPCSTKHLKSVHLTPSDPNYLKNLKGALRRMGCWEEERR